MVSLFKEKEEFIVLKNLRVIKWFVGMFSYLLKMKRIDVKFEILIVVEVVL